MAGTDMSFSALAKLGMSKASERKGKPAFTVEQFLEGKKKREKEIAIDFLEFVNEYYEKHPPDFTDIEETLQLGTVKDDKVLKAVHQKGKVVFIASTFTIGEYSYKEIWSILEFGRKDVGILPQPILRKCFETYHPRYKKMVKEFLKGNKP